MKFTSKEESMSGLIGAEEIDLDTGIDLVLLQVEELEAKEKDNKISYMRLKRELSKKVSINLAGDAIWESEKRGLIGLGEELEIISQKEKAKPITITDEGRKKIQKIKEAKQQKTL